MSFLVTPPYGPLEEGLSALSKSLPAHIPDAACVACPQSPARRQGQLPPQPARVPARCGQDVTLQGIKTQPLTYTKQSAADLEALRKNFDSTARYDAVTQGIAPRSVAENRSNFLKGLAADPAKVAQLKDAGISDQGIKLMQDGKLPSRAWQVHHKLPLLMR